MLKGREIGIIVLFVHVQGQVLRKTQVVPSGHFLVAMINFGTSDMGKEGRGRHGNCPTIAAGAQFCQKN